MTIVIHGAPVTKKNSQQMVPVRGRWIPVQSKTHKTWFKHALLQARSQWRGRAALTVPCELKACFYRAKAVGDLGNYLAALCDLLERAGVVENDRLIQSFDGCRLDKDAARPRIECELIPLTVTR